MDSALAQKGNEMSDLANDSKPQHLNEETLRKVLRITMMIWAVLLFVSQMPSPVFVSITNAFMELPTRYSAIILIFMRLPYWALIPFGVVTILWAVRSLKASSRVVVLCAGAVMIITTLWYIFNLTWFRIWVSMYSFSSHPWVQILSMASHIVFMSLWPLLLTGGLLLQKERRGVWLWIAGVLALLAWTLVMVIVIFNTSVDSIPFALFAIVISTLCIAISLKRYKPAPGPIPS